MRKFEIKKNNNGWIVATSTEIISINRDKGMPNSILPLVREIIRLVLPYGWKYSLTSESNIELMITVESPLGLGVADVVIPFPKSEYDISIIINAVSTAFDEAREGIIVVDGKGSFEL